MVTRDSNEQHNIGESQYKRDVIGENNDASGGGIILWANPTFNQFFEQHVAWLGLSYKLEDLFFDLRTESKNRHEKIKNPRRFSVGVGSWQLIEKNDL